MVGVIMSYPVSDQHLMLSEDNTEISQTFSNVKKRLLRDVDEMTKQGIFLSDIFPYTGVPNELGAPHPGNVEHGQGKELQAQRLLMASPKVMVVCGASARHAVDQVIRAHNDWTFLDMTETIGFPSCFVIINGRATLIIAQPNPITDISYANIRTKCGYIFGTRAALVRSILNRSPFVDLPVHPPALIPTRIITINPKCPAPILYANDNYDEFEWEGPPRFLQYQNRSSDTVHFITRRDPLTTACGHTKIQDLEPAQEVYERNHPKMCAICPTTSSPYWIRGHN
ncbi:hypothetical protein SAMD00019534_085240 [Acytostelium subglobosum LB1]|uniref:hypothetical protein n=1 Tax=Acytostelium subglobosum LB1 TaxID=1410327 RepID=UPI000644BC0D|nr:hypothetical protein SAMD00019534_085240 [Acytostelium subglobosum LB1]GAM25349.1 hypothetical protein SAMD00019534_085240 [Acytostelium subglobosum LB1]|eukprot:XP_012751869.1 hypothetical protein SAMD00019534_085240 [Acytostelium subglobosum LB1]